MNTYELLVTIVLLVAYSVFSVWAVTRFRRLATGITGSIFLAAGGIGVYLSGVFVAALILWLLRILLIIGIIALVILLIYGLSG